ncbi:4Fe-4S dicluster domain-containing protein [Thermodesulfobacteriota bacterium]
MKTLDRPRYNVVGEMIPFDERDNVHARYELAPDTDAWRAFYQKHPGWEKMDLGTKGLPGIGQVGNERDLPMLWSQRKILQWLGSEAIVDGPASDKKQEITPARAAEKVKGFARHLGVDLVRIGPLNQAHVYTHVGKTAHCPEKERNTPISVSHKHAVSLAVGSNVNLIKTGPVLTEIMEMMRVYTILAKVSATLAAYIRHLGYPARAHNLRNYLVLCIPIAIDAGIGELSRMGTLISKEFGPCLKLATVTTDLNMDYDPPVDIGVEEFCEDCKICADSCPSGAIPHGDRTQIRGVEKWKIKPEPCFRVWCETGTDCGVCIASCPWSKPRTPFHNLMKEIAARKHRAGLWMSWGEKLVYGKFKPKAVPDWMEEPDYSIWDKYKRLNKSK